jgi:pheromone shutdown protein TraB
MLAAIRAAEAIGATVVAADREISTTLRRSYASLKPLNKVRVLGGILASLFFEHEITEEEAESLKDRIVAVVGMGHVEGMKRHLGAQIDRAALDVVPQGSMLSRIARWILPVLVLAAFIVGYRRDGAGGLYDMLFAFAVPCSVAAALAAFAAGAKWLTTLGTLVLSPLVTLFPVVGAGILAGFLDARNRKPNAGDGRRLQEDLLTVRGLYGNAFVRVLLVSAAVSVGGTLGALTGGILVFTLL